MEKMINNKGQRHDLARGPSIEPSATVPSCG